MKTFLEYNKDTLRLSVYKGSKLAVERIASNMTVELMIDVLEATVDADTFEVHREGILVLVKWETRK